VESPISVSGSQACYNAKTYYREGNYVNISISDLSMGMGTSPFSGYWREEGNRSFEAQSLTFMVVKMHFLSARFCSSLSIKVTLRNAQTFRNNNLLHDKMSCSSSSSSGSWSLLNSSVSFLKKNESC